MTSRRVQTWVWWLLPLLVARALMPVGFMAQVHDGQLQIVFCSAGQLALADADQDGDHDVTQGDLPCPFAQAAAAPLPDVTGSEPIPFILSAAILPTAESPYYASGPPRFIATRGPPVSL